MKPEIKAALNRMDAQWAEQNEKNQAEFERENAAEKKAQAEQRLLGFFGPLARKVLTDAGIANPTRAELLEAAAGIDDRTTKLILVDTPPQTIADPKPAAPPAAPITPPTTTPAATSPLPECTHNADYTMVRWYGREYVFSLGVQSQVVGRLWGEWEKSGLGLHQATICQDIDDERESLRIDMVFRDHPAMGAMIQKAGDGRYKLDRPADKPQKKDKKRRISV